MSIEVKNIDNSVEMDIQDDIRKTMCINLDDKRVQDAIKQIQNADLDSVKKIGSDIQNDISKDIKNITSQCKTLDCGEAGKLLTELNLATEVKLNGNWFENKVLGARLAYKGFMSRYKKASDNLREIVNKVEEHKNELEYSFRGLSKLIEISKKSFNELEYYVEAFKYCVEEQELKCKGLSMDSLDGLSEYQKLQVYRRRLDTLQASRVVLYQTAKEAMILTITNRTLIDDMQYTVDNIIPLWEAQIITASNAEIQRRALTINSAVRENFNNMLVGNAKVIKENAIKIMEDSNSSVISVEALDKVDVQLKELRNRLKENIEKNSSQYISSINKINKLLGNGIDE